MLIGACLLRLDVPVEMRVMVIGPLDEIGRFPATGASRSRATDTSILDPQPERIVRILLVPRRVDNLDPRPIRREQLQHLCRRGGSRSRDVRIVKRVVTRNSKY